MSELNIIHKFNENACEIKVPIKKRGKNDSNFDVFINESIFVLVSDVDKHTFICPRKFNLEEMKNISICFNSEQWEYTCILPCDPNDSNEIEISENVESYVDNYSKFICITDSCVLFLDGKICDIQADFPYGFDRIYRGKPKYNEGDLSKICRLTDPSLLSSVKRIIQREKDEIKDFSPEQYKLNFFELQIPEGHENPMNYTIPYEDVSLTVEEECILEKIKSKHPHIDVETDRKHIDYGLVSILLGIMYDVRLTSNEPTCESHWTRTILSPVLSYFEEFENIKFVLESFFRRSLIYPLYRCRDLSQLCVSDVAEGMKKGKSWILKQLLVTYKCFCEADFNKKALNKYFIRHYIWYVDKEMDDVHIRKLSTDLSYVCRSITDDNLRLGLNEIQFELLSEIFSDTSLRTERDLHEIVESSNEGSSSESDSEYESDSYCSS